MTQTAVEVNACDEDFSDCTTPFEDADDTASTILPKSTWTLMEAKNAIERIKRLEEERKKTIKDADRKANSLSQVELLKLHDHAGYKALGYNTLQECLKTEFPKSASNRHLNRLLKAARFERAIFGPNCILGTIKEGVSRPLSALPEEDWADAWKEAEELARIKTYTGKAAKFHTGKVRSRITEAVAERRRMESGTETKKKIGLRKAAPKKARNLRLLYCLLKTRLLEEPEEAAINAFWVDTEHAAVIVDFTTQDGRQITGRISMIDRHLRSIAGQMKNVAEIILSTGGDPHLLRSIQAEYAHA